MNDPIARTTDGHIDVEAERHHLDELHDHIDQVRRQAHEDLDVGGKGRMFADEGVVRQVARDGDTHH